jgi:two-component system chemotaxis response regulator CheY
VSVVMIVDDDEDIRSALRLCLERDGHEVVPCEHGRAALDRLVEGDLPDVIVLDLMMPVMNGFELLQVLKQDPAWSRIPVVVVSANRGYSGDDLGVSRILRKPFDLDDLVHAISGAGTSPGT